jgi:hypothetical protein
VRCSICGRGQVLVGSSTVLALGSVAGILARDLIVWVVVWLEACYRVRVVGVSARRVIGVVSQAYQRDVLSVCKAGRYKACRSEAYQYGACWLRRAVIV